MQRWNPGFSARLAENGTLPPWTSPPDGDRAMWKTARFAASPMCCGSNMTIRRRNSLLRRSWSEGRKTGFFRDDDASFTTIRYGNLQQHPDYSEQLAEAHLATYS